MSERFVYLAGPVEIVDTWRERAARELEAAGYTPLNPLRGEDYAQCGKHIKSSIPDQLIVTRDLNDLARTEYSGGLCLMNLSSTAEGRRPIGTLFELQWCYDHRLPVVAVMGSKCDPAYRKHPWIKVMVGYEAASVTEALALINTYFL
jgi:hypothetical protein